MILRSIPPANRRPIRLNSMRIAVGGCIGPAQLDVSVGNSRPKIVLPDPRQQEQKGNYYRALQTLAGNLENLIASAGPAEANFWRQQLARLKGFGV